ncbi:MerR family transcriptional regulator [Cyanobacterium stanieri LEGE 03274]|uniref:MerR family transcriptional regulator n=1 Tax=Cyanobacterium stanieri LEGE 03274 TaxID=1828756 RepID=A0ABR9V3B8_9CHRO|nr:MerR family transcriptional regulator [Cyanobacterium stanieri]MBE9222390.1 MerR family transcriptional regulator [Cyanobacterium stanieri LEGE 03274]
MDLKSLENSHQEWLIDQFVEVANQLLPDYFPEIKGNTKVKEEINTRLVRSYTSQKLMDEPIRQSRYAFYNYRHLLQLLLIKRLLSDGIGTSAINDLLTSKTNQELKSLLVGGVQIHITTAHPTVSDNAGSSNSALDFLADLKKNKPSTPLQFRPSHQNERTMSALDNSLADNLGKDELDMSEGERWTRLRVVDGLELHIRDDFLYPNSIKEKESLMEHLSNILSKWFKKR